MRAAGISGFNRAKAQAVVDYHAGGTISEIMGSDDWGTSSHTTRPEDAGGTTRAGSDACDRVELRPFLPTDAGCTGMHTGTMFGTTEYALCVYLDLQC